MVGMINNTYLVDEWVDQDERDRQEVESDLDWEWVKRQDESHTVKQARDIVAGRSKKTPTIEHLRVLLEWLDGVAPDGVDWDIEEPF